MRCITTFAVATFVLATAPVLAQQGNNWQPAAESNLFMLMYPELWDELRVTPPQREMIVLLQFDLRDLEAAARASGDQGAFGKIHSNADRIVNSILNERQAARLAQVKLQRGGMAVLKQPDVLERLKLNDDQKLEIRSLAKESWTEKLPEILDEEQRGEWDSLYGKPLNLDPFPPAYRPQRRRRQR